MFAGLPRCAAWRHRDARVGFETVFFREYHWGHRLEGHTAAVEDGEPWVVRYEIDLDRNWLSVSSRLWGWSEAGFRELILRSDRSGTWTANGTQMREIDGCLDLDLETSACTNTIPIHRMDLPVGRWSEAPAVFVRVDLTIERLDQDYRRLDEGGGAFVYDYRAPRFGFEGRLVADRSGLVVEYPGIASRVL